MKIPGTYVKAHVKENLLQKWKKKMSLVVAQHTCGDKAEDEFRFRAIK